MSHSHDQLPANPNSNRNRVPQGAELASLHATASHLQTVIDHNAQAAKVALEQYHEIKARYDAQALILEELGSELHAAKLSADVLEEQASSLEPKLQELRGLLNPIRRYSDDILRLIFEEYVADWTKFDLEGFLAATLLSHVCRRWRSIALSTPTIWMYVVFEPRFSTGASLEKAVAFCDRVKALPTTIHIVINGDAVEDTACIPFSTICRVPVISHLVFSILGNSAAALNAVWGFPKCHIDRLQLIDSGSGLSHFGSFLSKFRSFRKVEVEYGDFGSFISPNLSNALSKLEEIDFIGVYQVPILDLLAMAPQLRILTLHQCSTMWNSAGEIDQCTLPNLLRLSAEYEDAPWSKIRAPSLMKLSTYRLPTISDPDKFWGFLSQCHAITEMTFADPNPEQVALLAGLVPKLTHLTIKHGSTTEIISILMGSEGSQLPSPPFPSLERLRLVGDWKDLEVATLEALIRSRCLFRGHPESTMRDGIQQTLRFLEIEISFWGVEWSHTPFLEKYLVKAYSNRVVYRAIGQA